MLRSENSGFDVADVENIKCSACGAINMADAEQCESCGNNLHRADYKASVKAGLKRLESEKLSLLGNSVMVSKFDPEAVASYATQPSASPTQTEVSSTMSSDAVSLSPVGAFVADEVDNLLQEGARTQTDVNSPMATLNFAAIRTYESSEMSRATTYPSMKGGMEADDEEEAGDRTISITRESRDAVKTSEKDPQEDSEYGDDPGDETTAIPRPEILLSDENSSIQDLSESGIVIAEDEEIPAGEENDFNGRATVDSGAAAMRVRQMLAEKPKAAPPPLNTVPDAMLNAHTGVRDHHAPKARILKPQASIVKTAKSENDLAVTAIEKLKKQGIFDPVQHAEVRQSFQSLEGLIPPSKISDWNESDDDEEELSDDCTYRQDPEVVEDIKFTAALARSAAKLDPVKKETREPKIIPTPNAENAELDSRDTIPIDLKSHPIHVEQMAVHRAKSTPTTPIVEMPHRESKYSNALWIALIAILVCGIIGMLYMMGILGYITPSLMPGKPSPIVSIISSSGQDSESLDEIRQSVARASFGVAMIVENDTWLNDWIDMVLPTMTSVEREAILNLGMAISPNNIDYIIMRVKDCIDKKQFEEARKVISQTPIEMFENVALHQLRYDVYAKDDHFMSPAAWLDESQFDEIAPLGGGSTLTFKFKLKGENAGAFKPLQTRRQSNYRSEIAAWRLCELLSCDFNIPWNRAIRIEKSVFNRLYNKSKSSKKDSYRKELVDIIWQKEDGRQVVYGTLKDWVGDFTRFPIEYTSMWKPWLSMKDYKTEFGSVAEELSALKRMSYTEKLYTEIIRLSPNISTQKLASQVSEILTFDFLIGNWDRFSGVRDWWGVNCQYEEDHIVSIDNGASFPGYSNDKVRERFMMTERFSAHFIELLRRLDKEQTLLLLFPESSDTEKKNFEQFWKQRDEVLRRVDELSKAYGTDHVLSFE